MKVYLVQNNQDIVMAVCLRKRSAELIAEKIGQVRWHEAWKVTPVTIGEVDPVMLAGSESYRKMMRQIDARLKPKPKVES